MGFHYLSKSDAENRPDSFHTFPDKKLRWYDESRFHFSTDSGKTWVRFDSRQFDSLISYGIINYYSPVSVSDDLYVWIFKDSEKNILYKEQFYR